MKTLLAPVRGYGRRIIAIIAFMLLQSPAFVQAAPPKGFDTCRAMADDEERLRCFKDLMIPQTGDDGNAAADAWPLLRTARPDGGPQAVSVMRTADTVRSDPNLAGLMIRCAENGRFELLLALITPLPPRTKSNVLLEAGSTRLRVEGESIASGMALLLSADAAAAAFGPWRDATDLAVVIDNPDHKISGHISLGGLSAALQKLSANCLSRTAPGSP